MRVKHDKRWSSATKIGTCVNEKATLIALSCHCDNVHDTEAVYSVVHLF